VEEVKLHFEHPPEPPVGVLDVDPSSATDDAMDHDGTAALAEILGLLQSDFLAAAGGAWRAFALDPATLADPQEDIGSYRWFISGEPPQVLLGISKGGVPDVAVVATPSPVPLVYGRGTNYAPLGTRVHVDRFEPGWLEQLAAAVRDVGQRRRKSFFWCSICRIANGPEDRHESGICNGCAEQYFGVVWLPHRGPEGVRLRTFSS
jgi:hypothetical protein